MKLPKKLLLLAALLLPLILWLALGDKLAAILAEKFGPVLARVGDGKFTDPVSFVLGRINEAVFLFYITAAIIAAGLTLRGLIDRFYQNRAIRGLRDGILVFVGLNLLVLACGNTVLFWSLFYDKVHIDNFAQYHIKRKLFSEDTGRQRLVLLGNSQTNRSIDEKILNAKLGEKIWSTDLTQPGTRGFDMLILERDIPLRKGDWVISYLSEIVFYGAGSGIVPPKFLHFADLDDLIELGGWNKLSPGSVRSGIAGRLIPLFRYRESISQRVLSWEIMGIDQFRHDSTLVPDLELQGSQNASGLHLSPGATFEKASFMRMSDELAALGCKLIIVDGDVHPALEKNLSPAVRQDMDRFLADLKSRHPGNVIVTDAGLYLRPTADAFDDLVHFTDAAQIEFTENLVDFLKQTYNASVK